MKNGFPHLTVSPTPQCVPLGRNKPVLNRLMRAKVPIPALFLMLAALACFPGSAHAGSYSVTYSGGTATAVANGETTTLNYTDNYGEYSGSGSTTWGATPGSVKCEGEITATFTWQPTPGGVGDTPPKKVVIAEDSHARTGGNAYKNSLPTTASTKSGNDFPDREMTTTEYYRYFDYGSTSGGTRYQIKEDPGPSFDVKCSPSAIIEATGVVGPPEGAGRGIASVSYRATALPLEIVLTGGIGGQNDKQYLIGQKVTASLSLGGLEAENLFSWEVYGGEPFKQWTPDQTQAVFTPLSTETDSLLTFYFRKAGFGTKSTISTPLHLLVPPGDLPAAGFSVFLDKQCTVKKPFNSLNAWTGIVRGAPDPTNPGGMVFDGAIGSSPTYDNSQLVTRGIIWEGSVTTPPEYGQGGGWNYTQIMNPHRVRQFNGVAEKLTMNDVWALDTRFPYGAPGLHPADGTLYKEGDTPGNSWDPGTTSFSVSDSFVTYTLYVPPGDESCYVPMKNLNWFWEGDAQPDSSGIWQISNGDGNWSFGEDYPSHPLWTSNINDGWDWVSQ